MADRTDPVQRASGRAGLPGSAPTGLSCVDRPLCTRIVAVAFSRKNDYFYVVKEHKASKMHFDAIVKALDRWFCFATAYPADNLNDAGKPPYTPPGAILGDEKAKVKHGASRSNELGAVLEL